MCDDNAPRDCTCKCACFQFGTFFAPSMARWRMVMMLLPGQTPNRDFPVPGYRWHSIKRAISMAGSARKHLRSLNFLAEKSSADVATSAIPQTGLGFWRFFGRPRFSLLPGAAALKVDGPGPSQDDTSPVVPKLLVCIGQLPENNVPKAPSPQGWLTRCRTTPPSAPPLPGPSPNRAPTL